MGLDGGSMSKSAEIKVGSVVTYHGSVTDWEGTDYQAGTYTVTRIAALPGSERLCYQLAATDNSGRALSLVHRGSVTLYRGEA
jgi:hypothetical protein